MDADLKSLKIDRSLKHAHGGGRGGGDGRGGWGWIAWAMPLAVLLIALAGGGWFFYDRIAAGSATEVQTFVVPVQHASTGNSGGVSGDDVVLNATGYIVAAHKIQLAPKVVGRVAWIGVEMGDKVEKGQVLVRLEDDEYRARYLQAKGQLGMAQARLAELENGSRPEEIKRAAAELQQARAELANAETNYNRYRDLVASGSIAAQQYDDAEAAWRAQKARVAALEAAYELVRQGPRQEQIDAQQAQVEQAQGVLALAEVDLANTEIRAPVAGTILDRNVEVGEYVTTGFVGDGGAKGYVVSMADLNELRVELDISQDDFARIAPDQRCWVTTDAYRDRRYEGVVDLISPEANRQKATVLVKVKILEPDALLRPDMNATVGFRVADAANRPPRDDSSTTQPSSAADALRSVLSSVRIPASAVKDDAVFVIVDGRARRRPVEVGTATVRGVEIRGGLTGGEQIIVNPPAGLEDGQSVRPQEPQS